MPSVHFRAPFAQRVNALCRAFKPDAVAVELDPKVACRVTDALGRLCTGGGRPKILPCMFALAEKTAAFESAGSGASGSNSPGHTNPTHKDSSESSNSGCVRIMYLSPTDSIVEAARCARELDVPLYGVDIESGGINQPCYWGIQDPGFAANDFESYVRRNERFADSHRTLADDLPREIAMAGALRTLLERHRSVVFVCGLAHWHSIEHLLDSGIEGRDLPSGSMPTPGQTRALTLIHPQLAAPYMDLSPAFAATFEYVRRPATYPPGIPEGYPDRSSHFQGLLKRCYTEYFSPNASTQQIDSKFPDWLASRDFEGLLRNMSVVQQVPVPHMGATLTASQGIMSRAFRESLIKLFMDFPWANPADYPDCAVLLPVYDSPGAKRQVQIADPNGNLSGPYGVESNIPMTAGSDAFPWVWGDEPCAPGERYSGFRSNWMPIGYFRMAMELEAIDELRVYREQKRPQAFEGSIEEGIDVRSTIRAASRGERRVHVRTRSRRRENRTEDAAHGYPLIWLFRSDTDPRMDLQFGGDRLHQYEPYVSDRSRLSADGREKSNRVVMDIRYCTEVRDATLSRPGCNVTREEVGGVLSFQPGSFTVKQMAVWCERTNYARNPICYFFFGGGGLPFGFERYYEERFGIHLGSKPWHTTLLLAALPFARGAITLIAPDDYTIAHEVKEQASRRHIAIQRIPLSRFPLDKLRYAAQHIMIPILGRTVPEDLPIYPSHVCRMLGESPRRNLELLPKRIANYEDCGS